MDAFAEIFHDFIYTFLPSLFIALIYIIAGFISLYRYYKSQYRPNLFLGLGLLFMGIGYLFSHFEIGNRDLRHAMLRFSFFHVAIVILMRDVWGLLSEHR